MEKTCKCPIGSYRVHVHVHISSDMVIFCLYVCLSHKSLHSIVLGNSVVPILHTYIKYRFSQSIYILYWLRSIECLWSKKLLLSEMVIKTGPTTPDHSSVFARSSTIYFIS